MKKIKLFTAVVVVTSLLGITSLAAVTSGINGVNKVENADTVEAINNNADILGAHIGEIANADTLGHIKMGDGLQVAEDGTASVKIADNLETDDSTAALSAAMGAELNNDINSLYDSLTWKLLGTNTGTTAFTLPEDYSELFIMVALDDESYVFNVPKISLSSSTKLLINGYGQDANTMNVTAVNVSLTEVSLYEVIYNAGNSDFTSYSTISVYYR